MSAKLKVTVLSRDERIFEDWALSLSSKNSLGNLDIYPGHINFVATIIERVAIDLENKKTKEISFDNAILKVKNDEVEIFLGI